MTEKEKMLADEVYSVVDPELIEEFQLILWKFLLECFDNFHLPRSVEPTIWYVEYFMCVL